MFLSLHECDADVPVMTLTRRRPALACPWVTATCAHSRTWTHRCHELRMCLVWSTKTTAEHGQRWSEGGGRNAPWNDSQTTKLILRALCGRRTPRLPSQTSGGTLASSQRDDCTGQAAHARLSHTAPLYLHLLYVYHICISVCIYNGCCLLGIKMPQSWSWERLWSIILIMHNVTYKICN